MSTSVAYSDVNFEHSVFRIKDILFNLFPNTKEKFDADWINNKIRVKSISSFIVYKDYRLSFSCKKKIGENQKEYYHYKIQGVTEESQKKLLVVIDKVYKNSTALVNKWTSNPHEYEKDFKWFEFNSVAELAIAEELTKRDILFFCNAKCLISNRYNEQERTEPDFLVVYQGKARILEVDGKEYHKDQFKDYRRDRLFERHGLRITRFTFDECVADSKRVIDEFLELFEDGVNYFHQLARIFSQSSVES